VQQKTGHSIRLARLQLSKHDLRFAVASLNQGPTGMRWVTITSIDGLEHVFNLDHVVQVVTQNGTTSRQVQLTNGEKILIAENDWYKKLQQEIQRSRNG
jgi:hypothetical protein